MVWGLICTAHNNGFAESIAGWLSNVLSFAINFIRAEPAWFVFLIAFLSFEERRGMVGVVMAPFSITGSVQLTLPGL